MRYGNMCPGVFLSRPNRFVARVVLEGREETVHVKNTGRCRELLVPGCTVWCRRSENPARKTGYDLIAVEKGSRLINMDSQAPNIAVGEWLSRGGLGEIRELRPETQWGDSRFDFSFRRGDTFCLLEVKGVTLEDAGVCSFPDAPTVRGAKHLRGLAAAAAGGIECYALFVIQMEGVRFLHPNDRTDPAFGNALRAAESAGVKILAYDCTVTPDSMALKSPVPVQLAPDFRC